MQSLSLPYKFYSLNFFINIITTKHGQMLLEVTSGIIKVLKLIFPRVILIIP